MFVSGDITINTFRDQTVETIARYRLPAIYAVRSFVTNGGLAYYGVDRISLYRRAASDVDQSLQGEKALGPWPS
jgi:ABC-type uncharacterized transport system substrate-binding protein